MREQQELVEFFGPDCIHLVEEKEEEKTLSEGLDTKKPLRIRGVAGKANIINENRRLYSADVYVTCIGKAQNKLQAGKILGEVDHPSAGSAGSLQRCAVKFDKLYMDGDLFKYECIVLPTQNGELLEKLLRSGVGLSNSTRGIGDVELKRTEDGKEIEIVKNYEIHGIDFVIEGSNPYGRPVAFENKKTPETTQEVSPDAEVTRAKEQPCLDTLRENLKQELFAELKTALEEQNASVSKPALCENPGEKVASTEDSGVTEATSEEKDTSQAEIPAEAIDEEREEEQEIMESEMFSIEKDIEEVEVNNTNSNSDFTTEIIEQTNIKETKGGMVIMTLEQLKKEHPDVITMLAEEIETKVKAELEEEAERILAQQEREEKKMLAMRESLYTDLMSQLEARLDTKLEAKLELAKAKKSDTPATIDTAYDKMGVVEKKCSEEEEAPEEESDDEGFEKFKALLKRKKKAESRLADLLGMLQEEKDEEAECEVCGNLESECECGKECKVKKESVSATKKFIAKEKQAVKVVTKNTPDSEKLRVGKTPITPEELDNQPDEEETEVGMTYGEADPPEPTKASKNLYTPAKNESVDIDALKAQLNEATAKLQILEEEKKVKEGMAKRAKAIEEELKDYKHRDILRPQLEECKTADEVKACSNKYKALIEGIKGQSEQTAPTGQGAVVSNEKIGTTTAMLNEDNYRALELKRQRALAGLSGK